MINRIERTHTVVELHAVVQKWHDANLRVGLVPTMGALHEGHLSLIDNLAEKCDRIIVSIFVNPTQFAAHEDFDTYPSDINHDLSKIDSRVQLVYAPTVKTIYPAGYATRIVPDGVALGLEGDYRPHFFTGVATIVSKLLLQTRVDVAIFGEKDYQQLLMIRQLVRDLDIPVAIHAAPTIREADGLAMSSRNMYLSAAARTQAAALPKILNDLAHNELARAVAEQQAQDMLLATGFESVDYACLRDAETLAVPNATTKSCRALIAARLEGVRLIDNCAVPNT